MSLTDLTDLTDSRAATDTLLSMLREERPGPQAWGRFLARSAHRSLHQAARRPHALAELTALHGLFLATARGSRPQRRWIAASWTLTATHLGLLENRRHLAPADVLTLVRANLPALPGGSGRWSGVIAVALDLADGNLARHQGTVSPFGDYADSFADAAFWTWLTWHHEPNAVLKATAVAAWALPIAAVTTTAIGRGAMPERPRPALLRPAAAMQVVAALRHLTRDQAPWRGPGPRGRS